MPYTAVFSAWSFPVSHALQHFSRDLIRARRTGGDFIKASSQQLLRLRLIQHPLSDCAIDHRACPRCETSFAALGELAARSQVLVMTIEGSGELGDAVPLRGDGGEHR